MFDNLNNTLKKIKWLIGWLVINGKQQIIIEFLIFKIFLFSFSSAATGRPKALILLK